MNANTNLKATPTLINANDYKPSIFPIAIATDANYAKYVAVLLQSITTNANPDNSYLIIILDCGGFKEVSSDIYQQLKQFSNFQLTIINMEQVLAQHKDSFREVSYFSIAMYARLFIPTICQQFKYVLYMDVDMICNLDVAEIFNYDLADNYIAGVPDLELEADRALYESSRNFVKENYDLDLHNSYINSGLLLFNIERWNTLNLLQQAINLLHNNSYQCPDQDVINIICKDKLYVLSQKYNLLYGVYLNTRIRNNLDNLQKSKYAFNLFKEFEFLISQDNKIIHYNVDKHLKPWKKGLEGDAFINKWWEYCSQTDFYDEIFKQCLITNLVHETYVPNRKVSLFGVPLLKINRNQKQFKYYLFGVPIFKIRIKNNLKIWYLLCFIKILTIKYI